MRAFEYPSVFKGGSLVLALASALTPAGVDDDPCFLKGFAVYPQVLARGLLVLADVTSTRYFNYTPVSMRDPVLSAQGDRLRAECFSACNSVYARLDLLQSGFDGEIGYGTTNVDIGAELRKALTQVKKEDRLRVEVGRGGLAASHFGSLAEDIVGLEAEVRQRPVQMPDRWVRALGNVAGIHRDMRPAFTLNAPQAMAFVASLPSATGKAQSGWLTPSPAGVKLMPRRAPGAVKVAGLHRLSALKRVMTDMTGMTVYAPAEPDTGLLMAEAGLPGARITLGLTAEAWQGHSGEGSLLESLARQDVLEDAESVGSALEFDAAVDEARIASRWDMSEERVQAALALLAVSGKLGFDAHDGAYFHRELPDEPDRVLKDNPRLVAARKLTEAAEDVGGGQWAVRSNGTEYRVCYDPVQGAQGARCTCTWYLNHQNRRGPCKHILAVQLKEEKE